MAIEEACERSRIRPTLPRKKHEWVHFESAGARQRLHFGIRWTDEPDVHARLGQSEAEMERGGN